MYIQTKVFGVEGPLIMSCDSRMTNLLRKFRIDFSAVIEVHGVNSLPSSQRYNLYEHNIHKNGVFILSLCPHCYILQHWQVPSAANWRCWKQEPRQTSEFLILYNGLLILSLSMCEFYTDWLSVRAQTLRHIRLGELLQEYSSEARLIVM